MIESNQANALTERLPGLMPAPELLAARVNSTTLCISGLSSLIWMTCLVDWFGALLTFPIVLSLYAAFRIVLIRADVGFL